MPDKSLKMKAIKIALLLALIAAITGFFSFDLKEYFTLEYLKNQQTGIQEYYGKNTIAAVGIFMLIYITVTALSLPGALILTIAAGAFFNLIAGVITVSFASTIGATIAFLLSRFLLNDYVQNKYGGRLKPINEGFKKEGAFYLFALRLVPVFPFFLINILMGLTPIRTIVFFFVSQVGMLPGTIAYVYAGMEIGQIESLNDIISFDIIGAFVILGLFPILAKKFIEFIRKKNA